MRLLAIVLVLWSAGPRAIAQPLPQPALPFGRIVDIRVEGTERQQPAAVRHVIGTHIGAYLDPDQLREDLIAIRALRSGESSVFDDVSIEVEELPDGLRVIYVVTERPRISEVEFDHRPGAPLVDEARDDWPIAAGDLYDPTRVAAAERDVEALYRSEGFAFGRVATQLDGSLLVVELDPGPEVEVRRITFSGNTALSDDQLAEILLTEAVDLPLGLVGRGRFDRSVLAGDRRRLMTRYQYEGYADVRVSPAIVEMQPDRRGVFVQFDIDEGERYRVESVALAGDFMAPADTLRHEFVTARPGDWLSLLVTERDLARLETAYRDAGFARARVRLESERQPTEPRRETSSPPTIALTYRIEQGPPTWIGRIEVTGNAVTSDAVVRRQLRLHESDPYSDSALRESRARLERLGPFESVEIREIDTDQPEIIDLEVAVVERDLILPAASVGVGTDGTVSVAGQLATPNFLGRGQLLAARVDIGTLRSGVSLAVTDPDVRATGWRLAGRLFWEDLTYPSFAREALGAGLTAGYPLRRDLRVSGGYLFESVGLDADGSDSEAGDALGDLYTAGRTARLVTSLEWDTRDHPITPRSGFQNVVTASWAGGPIGSEVDFVRLDVASRWFAPLGPLTFRANVELGYLVSTDSTRRVPIGERYFLGGVDSVRGFEPYSLSPVEPIATGSDPSSETTDFTIGGNKSLLANLELGFPLVPQLGLEGVVFFDVGNTFEEDERYTFELDVLDDRRAQRARLLRTSAGLGLRWTIFQGVPLRFEWGFPLAPVEGEPSMVFSVGAGVAF